MKSRTHYAGRADSYVFLHRAMTRPERTSVRSALMLGGLLTLWWLLLQPVAATGWVKIFDLLHDPIGISQGTNVHEWGVGSWVFIRLPEAVLPTVMPSVMQLIFVGLTSVACLALTWFIPAERVPLRYFLRFLSVMVGTAVLFFALFPEYWAYDTAAYGVGMMSAATGLMTIVPLMLSISHQLFDFSMAQKVGLTLLIMGFLYVLVPLQYAAHLIILHQGSALWLPLLFILFGLPLDVLVFIGLFSWGMSWEAPESSDQERMQARVRQFRRGVRYGVLYRGRLARRIGMASVILVLAAGTAHGQVSLTRTSAEIMDIDSGTSLTSAYASYSLSASGATSYNEIWVEIGSFTGGVISLGSSENAQYKVGDLSSGSSAPVFYYLTASGATASAQGHTITVWEGKPGTGTQLLSETFTISAVEETIQAKANKVTTTVVGPNPPGLGGIVTVTVNGETGTLGNSKTVSFSPATYDTWPADAYELLSTSITFSGGNNTTLTNQLYAVLGSKSASTYTATYTFQARGVTTAPTSVSPVGYISSGSQVKHTDTSNFTSLQPIQPADNQLYLPSKTASPSSLSGAGTVTYTVRFTNDGSSSADLDELIDILPTGTSYVTGSVRLDGAAFPEPSIDGQTLTWIDGLSLAASSSYDLTYDVTFPATAGSYVNEAKAVIGSVQIDNTKLTSDDVSTAATVTVENADLALAFAVDNPAPSENGSVTYTLTLTNQGASTATGITVTAPLPGAVSYTSHSASAGTFASGTGVWSVPSLASLASITLDITVSTSGTATIAYSGEITASSHHDPDSTPNNSSISEDDDDSVDVTPSGSSGGGGGGLESNGSLAQKLASVLYQRRLDKADDPFSGLPVFQSSVLPTGKTASAAALLEAAIPPFGPQQAPAFETSPQDLLPVTNAVEVRAVDYLRSTDATRLGVLFGTVTEGSIYEHTKVVCDRLKGAELSGVESAFVRGRPFVISRLLHEDGTVDHAISFVVYRLGDYLFVDSRFGLDEYQVPAGATAILNLQVWSVSREWTQHLVANVLDRLDQAGSVRFVNEPSNPPQIPSTYVRSGRYVNGQLELDVVNPGAASTLRITDATIARVENGDRESFQHVAPLPAGKQSDVVTVTIPTGTLFDASFVVETADGSRDLLYVSDGSWSHTSDDEGARIDQIRVSAADDLSADLAGKRTVERSAHMSGDVRTWAVLFRYLRSNGRPIDLSEHQYVEFEAWGEGQVRILFEKESIETSDHFGTYIKLESTPKRYRIWFDDIRKADGSGRLTAEDLVLISFYVIGQQERTTPFELNVSELQFGGAEGDRLAEIPATPELKQNYPNPFNPTTVIPFGLEEDGRVKLTVYDMLGRRVAVLVDRHLTAGRHEVSWNASGLSSGSYLYRLQTAGRTISRHMMLIK